MYFLPFIFHSWSNSRMESCQRTHLLPWFSEQFLWEWRMYILLVFTFTSQYHHHHHHHIALVARISLTLSRHSSLSFIALGGSSGQHPVSSHSCWMYVRAGHPAFARPCVGVHKNTSLGRCPWCNCYRSRKWTRRHEFKSWAILIAFHIALIPLGKLWIQLFSLQLWVNSRTD